MSPRDLPSLRAWNCRCLHCHAALAADAGGLRCSGCGRQYPVVAGVPVLVKDPHGYTRSQIRTLARACSEARHRKDSLEALARDAGLLDVALQRHRDTLDAEIARAETLLGLFSSGEIAMAPAEKAEGGRGTGWTVDALLPYLMRDWTGTREMEQVSARLGAALHQALPDPSGKSVVFAACGAGGLLGELPPQFDQVLGFDLTLPVLAAARRLLDGGSLDLVLPRTINKAGRVTLRKRDPGLGRPAAALVAMDAFDTAFPDASVDCVVTSFLIDLLADPRGLADEIHRILRGGGVWINYGPSGPLNALLRFDEIETAAFLEDAGFSIVATDAYRATYLDLSRDCPTWSFQNHVCYLTSARKAGPPRPRVEATGPETADIPAIVPKHFPRATIIRRQRPGMEQTARTVLQHEGMPGRPKSLEIGGDAARILSLVDGKRTVNDIAGLLERETPGQPAEETFRAFAQYFKQGLLNWRNS